MQYTVMDAYLERRLDPVIHTTLFSALNQRKTSER